jgi:ribose transport system permease protein
MPDTSPSQLDAAVPLGARFRSSITGYGIVWVTIALFILLTLTTGPFLTEANLRNILDQQATLLIAASLATVAMIAGGFDISVSAVYVAAPLVALRVENATESVLLAIVAGILAGLVVGTVNGLVVAVLKVHSFIGTLATSFMVFGAGYLISDRSILRPTTDTFRNVARTRWFTLTTATWIALGVVVLTWFLLSRTRFGRHVYATGGNPEAARLAGVRVTGVTVAVFMLSGAAAGLAGTVSASRTISAMPSDDFSFLFGVLSAIVVGGTSIAGGEGGVWRTVFGAFFIALMINGFNLHQVDPIWQRVIQGLVILIAVSIDAWSRRRQMH